MNLETLLKIIRDALTFKMYELGFHFFPMTKQFQNKIEKTPHIINSFSQ